MSFNSLYWTKLILEKKEFSSAHCVIFKNGKVLILRRSPSDHWMPGHYGLPGGKLEKGESMRDALSRECSEETSLKVSPDDLIFMPSISSELDHAFYYTTKSSGTPKLNSEHDDFAWVSPEKLSDYKVVSDLIATVEAAVESKDDKD